MKKVGLLLLVIVSVIISLPFLSAVSQYYGTYAVNQPVNLTQVCASCTYVNLQKVVLPDSSSIFINQNMTAEGSTYYYPFSNTSQYGEYIVTTCGDILSVYTCDSYRFLITQDGQVYDIEQSIALIPLILLMFLLFVIGYSFGTERWKLRSFFYACALLVSILSVNAVRIFFGTSEYLYTMGLTALIISIVIFSFFVMFLLIYYTKDVINQVKESKKKKRAEKSDPY